MNRCASCNSRLEEGLVHCMNCGADLSSPASFFQVIGWVFIAISSVPIGLGIVLEGKHDHVALIAGIAVLALGVLTVFVSSSMRKRKETSLIVSDDPAG